MGKRLTDAVSDILAGRTPDLSEQQGEDEDQQAGEDGAPSGERGAGREHEDDAIGQGSGADDQGEGHDAGSGDGEETTIEEVAKALKLNPTELNKVVFTVDGHRVSLGDLKAGYAKVAKFEQERAEFDERVTNTELEQIDAHRRIMAIIDSFPGQSLPPAVLRRVEGQMQDNQRREAALLHKARPQWGDPKYSERERGEMMSLAKRYGFSPAEIGSIIDHRQVLLLQDYAHALAKINAAKGAARKVTDDGNKPLNPEAARAANSGRAGQAVPITKKGALGRRVAELIARG